MNWHFLVRRSSVRTGTRRCFPALALACLVFSLWFLVDTGSAIAQQRTVPTTRQQIQLSFAPVVRATAPAVVNIYARRVSRQQASRLFDDPVFRRFFGEGGVPRDRVEQSLGSGVIVDASGLIVTNDHVIQGADEITVVLSDRREYAARLVVTDPRTDLAVLKVDAESQTLPALQMGSSDDLEVGDLVLAIGNPLGVGQTVTQGIVSAVARTRTGITDYSFFIQTDAAINQGNSGGALVTMDGRLVGINTAILSRSGGSIGIGLAIPSAMVRVVVDGAREGRRPVRPWFGISMQAVTTDIAANLRLPRPAGALVSQVERGSPADRAGVRRGDVITAINEREVDDPDALRFRIATLPIGQEAMATIYRDGRSRQVRFTATAPPEDPPRDETSITGRSPLAGATVANLSPALFEELTFPNLSVREGVVVLDIERGSPAARLGLRPGDVVLQVNGTAINTVRTLNRVAREAANGWRIQVRRGDQVLNSQVAG